MIKITEDSYSSYKDKDVDAQHFYYRDKDDVIQQGNVESMERWQAFQNKLKERGKKYRLISDADPLYKDLLKNKNLSTSEEARQRARYLAKNGCYLNNVRTYFDYNGIRIPCLIRVDDHIVDFHNAENKNSDIHCFICVILDDKGRKLENNPSNGDIVSIESYLNTNEEQDISKYYNFINLIESRKKTVFNIEDLKILLGNVTLNASIDGEIIMNANLQHLQAVLDPIADDIQREALLKQKHKEEVQSSKITSVNYEDIKDQVTKEEIFKKPYLTFVINGVKYASNDDLHTAYRVKSKGGVSKSAEEKIDIIHPTVVKVDDYTDAKEIDDKIWYLFNYDGDEYATDDGDIAYKIENGRLTDQTAEIKEMRKRKGRLIKLTETQYRMVKKLFLTV